jgi:hypothetical protein
MLKIKTLTHIETPLSVKQHAKTTQGFVWFINNMEAK